MLSTILASQIKGPDGRERKPEELHPIILQFLDYAYYAPLSSDPAQHAKFMLLYGERANPDIRQFVDEKLFQELCVEFATGMQYVYENHQGKGKHGHILLTIENMLSGNIHACCTSQIGPLQNECNTKIILTRWGMIRIRGRAKETGVEDQFSTEHVVGEKLNTHEYFRVLGGEEMKHAVDHQEFFMANGRTPLAQEIAAMEQAAKPIMMQLVEDYNLGPARRS